MKPVALYYDILQYQENNFRMLQDNFELVVLPDPAHDKNEILEHIEVLFAPLGYNVDRNKIDSCPKLRVIASNTTGHPHIDVDYARQKHIDVACLKFAQEFLKTISPTAELTFGLIIALTRNIIPGYLSVLDGGWNRRPFGGQAMLSSMQLGIVGLGRIGGMVAEYAKAFGMHVEYYDPFIDHAPDWIVSRESLLELVADNDIVSIHVPHEPSTENMFNEQVFKSFKQGGYLVNTARGELLDWNALLGALKSGQIAGAALDVFESEFDPEFSQILPTHPVLEYARNHDNLILTPHIGGSTMDAWAKTEQHTIEMVLDFLRK